MIDKIMSLDKVTQEEGLLIKNCKRGKYRDLEGNSI